MMARRILLSGPVLLGFADLFDAAYGRPCPPSEIPTVTPSAIGGAALPFPCPHCGAVRPQMVDKEARAEYADPERGFFFCPACEGRYRLGASASLPAEVHPGDAAAPCRVALGGASWIVMMNSMADDLDFLGTESSLARRQGSTFALAPGHLAQHKACS